MRPRPFTASTKALMPGALTLSSLVIKMVGISFVFADFAMGARYK
jgi:hypothetical protein